MLRENSDTPRRLIILGSTGSIGISAMEVVQHLMANEHAAFQVIGLAAGANAELLSEQAKALGVTHVAIADAAKAQALADLPRVYTGPGAAEELVRDIAQPGDLVLGAIVGSAGVPATLAAIDCGCDIALANKETLVAAGALVTPRVREKGVTLLPIDSEHSAVFQCLQAGRSIDEVRRLVITASGGPFRTWSKERINTASVEAPLNHPTWAMGPKVTIDSASLMNKALEIIEAHWLFGLPTEKIEVIIHPQSIVHSFVEFVDGSVMAQLGPPDMKTPIQYALTWPHRAPGCSRTMVWSELKRMDFEPVDHDRYPALNMAYRVIETGGTTGAIFNAANEAAVCAFVEKRIPFGQVLRLVCEAVDAIKPHPVRSLDDVLQADQAAREFVEASVTACVTAVSRAERTKTASDSCVSQERKPVNTAWNS